MTLETTEKEISAWRTLEKKKGKVQLFFAFVVIGLGVFVFTILAFIMLSGYNEFCGLIYLSIIGAILIFWGAKTIFSQKSPNSPSVEGIFRFNSEMMEFISEKNGIKIRIPLDANTYLYPLVCNAIYNDLCGLHIRRGKIYLEIEPFLGYSMKQIENELPTLIYFAKRKNVKFDKSWKHVRV